MPWALLVGPTQQPLMEELQSWTPTSAGGRAASACCPRAGVQAPASLGAALLCVPSQLGLWAHRTRPSCVEPSPVSGGGLGKAGPEPSPMVGSLWNSPSSLDPSSSQGTTCSTVQHPHCRKTESPYLLVQRKTFKIGPNCQWNTTLDCGQPPRDPWLGRSRSG